MVGLAVVYVEVEGALAGEQPVGLLQTRCEKREVVIEGVPVGGLGEQARPVAPALKAAPLALIVSGGGDGATCAGAPGVERRVDVDQLEGPVREGGEQLEVLAEEDLDRAPRQGVARPSQARLRSASDGGGATR